ncbi:MAG TPA: SCO family protein [Chitinophagaceae bacterium]|nr:SCO family protein [Chitinophagaceae bacterium]
MEKNKSGRLSRSITIFIVSFFIILGTAFSGFYYYNSKIIKKPNVAIQSQPGQVVRPFKFVNQEGDTITNKDIDGKIVVVEYFFTTCQGICPIMNDNMVRVYNEFRGNDDVVILSHTVDPKRDDVETLKAYSMKYDADPKKWMFLTGDKKALYDQAYYSYGLTTANELAENIDEDFIHSNVFVLVDKHGRLRMHLNKEKNPVPYDGTDEESVARLIEDIHEVLTED